MNNDSLESALRELLEERDRLDQVRADYVAMSRSRFHWLRMLWLSLKQLFGLASARDRFAVWSVDFETDGRRVGNGSAQAVEEEAEARLIRSWTLRHEAHPLSNAPIASVIIPAYNHAEVTIRCLQSIADAWFETLPVQIILVDDASSDSTSEIAAQLPGLVHVRNESNQGFLKSCNRGLEAATGSYVCFLNNDTTVQGGWLERLVLRADSDPTIGAVGAKLVYPNGTLQEAGGIIWGDATGWNYGRNGDPRDARYNYVRDVDYCSGAALLVRLEIMRRLGGFDQRFAPAYYEDVDICFAVRELGYRVVYEPRVEITHFEGVSSGTDVATGVKRFQLVNLPRFREKWKEQLGRHYAPNAVNVPQAARRLRKQHVILVIDEYVPMYDREAGSLRLLRVLEMLLDLGYHVIFLPENYAALQPYTAELQARGIEVLHHVENGRSMDEALSEILPIVDIAWISRPKLFEKYSKRIRRYPDIKIIFDTVDLHFVRMKREAELFDTGSSAWKSSERAEISAANAADATVAVTPDEAQILRELGVKNLAVIPTIHKIELTTQRRFEESKGILFIGGYNHPPNVDAVRWLCSEIMPLVWREIPDATVTLLGSSPPPDVLQLQSERVAVLGYVKDVAPHFMSSRVFAAPLRFGAGHKGKVGQSLSFGLPLVTTTVGAEGFGLCNGSSCLIADSTGDFAAALVKLYSERDEWQAISNASLDAVRQFTPAALQDTVAELFEGLLAKAKVK